MCDSRSRLTPRLTLRCHFMTHIRPACPMSYVASCLTLMCHLVSPQNGILAPAWPEAFFLTKPWNTCCMIHNGINQRRRTSDSRDVTKCASISDNLNPKENFARLQAKHVDTVHWLAGNGTFSVWFTIGAEWNVRQWSERHKTATFSQKSYILESKSSVCTQVKHHICLIFRSWSGSVMVYGRKW